MRHHVAEKIVVFNQQAPVGEVRRSHSRRLGRRRWSLPAPTSFHLGPALDQAGTVICLKYPPSPSLPLPPSVSVFPPSQRIRGRFVASGMCSVLQLLVGNMVDGGGASQGLNPQWCRGDVRGESAESGRRGEEHAEPGMQCGRCAGTGMGSAVSGNAPHPHPMPCQGRSFAR